MPPAPLLLGGLAAAGGVAAGSAMARRRQRTLLSGGSGEGLANPRSPGPDAEDTGRTAQPRPESVVAPPPPPDPIRAASDAALMARAAGERRRGRATAGSRTNRPRQVTGQRVGTRGETLLGRAMRSGTLLTDAVRPPRAYAR